MKRLIFVLTGVLAVALSPAGAEPIKVTIGHSTVRNEIAALWVPRETGIFARHGIDATVILVQGGRQMTQAIVSGSIPIGITGVPTVASAVAAGGDAVIVLSLTNRITFDIWARPEIKSPADFKGKTVGISGLGATSHLASVLMFRHFGLDPRRDRITLIGIGDEATRVQALLTGRIDATIVDPSVAGPVKAKGFSYLGNLETLGVPFINATLVTTRRYAKEQSRVVEGVIKAILEGNAFILNPANRKTVIEILSRQLRLDSDKAETAYKDLLPKVERKPYPPQEAIVSTIQVLAESNPKLSQLKPDDLVDLTVLKQLDQEGFVDRLYPR
jgi:NitT/TauT family transport system substrate-binding protein